MVPGGELITTTSPVEMQKGLEATASHLPSVPIPPATQEAAGQVQSSGSTTSDSSQQSNK